MLNDRSSALSLLETRRSGRPRDLVQPGPNPEQLRQILEIAARTPDHGKLSPWRFIHVRNEDRAAFGDMLEAAFREKEPDPRLPEIEAIHRLANQAPSLVVILFSPVESAKIPVYEQQLSCGAVCMNLLHAAHALGFAAGWITGWAAYSEAVLQGLGGRPGEKVAGFIFIGTPQFPLEERVRPDLGRMVEEWAPRRAGNEPLTA